MPDYTNFFQIPLTHWTVLFTVLATIQQIQIRLSLFILLNSISLATHWLLVSFCLSVKFHQNSVHHNKTYLHLILNLEWLANVQFQLLCRNFFGFRSKKKKKKSSNFYLVILSNAPRKNPGSGNAFWSALKYSHLTFQESPVVFRNIDLMY